MGWSATRLNALNQAFVDVCAANGCPAEAPGLDIGAGYGAATVAALAVGGHVIANDMDEEQLQEVARRAAGFGERFQMRRGALSGNARDRALHCEAESLGAIHASSVLHFLTGRRLERAFRQFALWLRSGGMLFVHAATPYQAPFAAFIPEFERRLAANETWPGWMERTRNYSTHRLLGQMPSSLHLLDDTVLRRLAEANGFVCERLWLFRRDDLPKSLHYDGRESVGLVARRR